MTHRQSIQSFFMSFFKGLMIVAGAIAGSLGALQILYALGWLAIAASPRHEASTISILGVERSFAASSPAPATAWMFAADSRPMMFGAGLVVLIYFAVFAFLVYWVARLGGWNWPNEKAFSK